MPPERTPMANITPFGLRMQPDLKARIEDVARVNNRSMNAEIVARLEASFTEGFIKAQQTDAFARLLLEKINDPLIVVKTLSRDELEAEITRRESEGE